MPARAIGRFEIEAEAASGSAGTVYQAFDPTRGIRVAVKVIHRVAGTEAPRFAREAGLLAQIRHPGVVRYVDHGTTEHGNAFLAMEWLEGEDLRSRLGREGISIDESVALGLRVAEALAAVHALGIVHRDIKPANLFLPGGEVAAAKIVDFGLVRGAGASADVTRTGMVVGTPSYMAPEQARAQRSVDARADLFSLGCVLYRCLTGRAPFEGSSVLAVLTKVLLEEPPAPRALRPEIPAALEGLVIRLLAKDPALRPPTAAAVASALSAIAATGTGEVPSRRTMPPGPTGSLSGSIAGLTAGERRIAAVLLIGGERPPAPRVEETLPSAEKGEAAAYAGGEDAGAEVLAHGGWLDVLLDGTRVVTFPGAPASDQALRAARCALALRAIAPGAAMAIATGRVEAGRAQRAGDAIDRAAALLALPEAAAEAPSIAIDDTTAALLGARFEVADGQLVGARGVPAAPTLLGRATPMVGRAWELGTIRDLFAACVEEREPRALLVTAAAGMGKSRLAHEAAAMLRDRAPGAVVAWGRGDPLRSGSALGVLGQLVRGVGAATEGEGRALAERLAGGLAATPGAGPEPLQDARQASERIHAAWEALVEAACAAAPLVLVIEDAHWADAATMRLVGGALASADRRALPVLALARPELHDSFPRLWEAQSPQEIRLGPLPRRAAERLVRGALDGAGAKTVDRLVQQADGNAFFLEELVRAVAGPFHDRGARAALPDTVLAMVEARLSALDAGLRRALRAASVFGEVFWPGAVGALLGGVAPEDDRGGVAGEALADEEWIDALEDREIVTVRADSRFAGEREIAFRHALLREGAYAMLTDADRALGHALAGAWLERRGETDAAVVADHFAAGGDEARAAPFYLAAAHQALCAAEVDVALTRTERALAAGLSPEDRVEALSFLVEAHAWRDDWGPVLARAGEVGGRVVEGRRAHRPVLARAGEVTDVAAPGSAPWIQAMSWKQSAAMALGRVDALLPTMLALTTIEGAPGTARVLLPGLAVTVHLMAMSGQVALAAGVAARMEAIAAAEGPDLPGLRFPIHLARAWIAVAALAHAWALDGG